MDLLEELFLLDLTIVELNKIKNGFIQIVMQMI